MFNMFSYYYCVKYVFLLIAPVIVIATDFLRKLFCILAHVMILGKVSECKTICQRTCEINLRSVDSQLIVVLSTRKSERGKRFV